MDHSMFCVFPIFPMVFPGFSNGFHGVFFSIAFVVAWNCADLNRRQAPEVGSRFVVVGAPWRCPWCCPKKWGISIAMGDPKMVGL